MAIARSGVQRPQQLGVINLLTCEEFPACLLRLFELNSNNSSVLNKPLNL